MKVQKCWTKINISSGAIVLGKTYLHLLKVRHQIWNHVEWMDVVVVPDLPVSWSYLLSITFDLCPSKTRQSEWKQGSANLNSINLNRGQDLDQSKYYAVTKSISNAAINAIKSKRAIMIIITWLFNIYVYMMFYKAGIKGKWSAPSVSALNQK